MISGMVFSKSDKPLTGLAAIVDSPISAVMLIVFFIIAIDVSIKYHSQSERSQFNIFNKATYVPLMEYYNNKYLNESESGKDVRLFNEKLLITEEIREKIYNPVIKTRSEIFRVWATKGQVSAVNAQLLGGLVYILSA